MKLVTKPDKKKLFCKKKSLPSNKPIVEEGQALAFKLFNDEQN